MNPLVAKAVASAALAAALFGAGFAGGFKWQAAPVAKLKLEHAKLELEHKDERIASQRAARVVAERQEARAGAARTQAQENAERLAADLRSNRTELERLRDATTTAMRAASTSLEACVAHAATQGEVLNSCAADLVDVSAKADGHVDDIQSLEATWPQE